MYRDLFLKRVPIFARVSGKELGDIARIAQQKKFKKGEYIFYEGEEGECLYIILSGMVKVFKSATGGRVKTLAILEKGDFLGEMSILDKEIRSATAELLDDTEVLVLNKRNFEKYLKRNAEMTMKILKTLCSRLRVADRDIHALAFQNVLGRVAITLINLAHRHGVKTYKGTKIDMKITHQELADMVGTAREMVSRTLLSFKKNKCIDIDGSVITVTNMKTLKDLIY